MANNCLITKLKSVVSNDSLDYIGYVKLSANTSSDKVVIFNLLYDEASELKIEGDGHFTNAQGDNLGKTYACAAGTAEYPRTVGTSYKILLPKYNLTRFSINSSSTYGLPVEVRQFKGCNKLATFQPQKAVVSGDLSELMYNLPVLSTVGINGADASNSKIVGVFNETVGEYSYIDFSVTGWALLGDINNFKNWKGNAGATFKWKNTRINGELSSLFDYIAEHGSISTLTITPNTLTTLNGVATTVTQKTVTFSGGSWSIA